VFPNEETQAAPFTLNCMYCQWSSTEIGLEFEKPTGIHGKPRHSTGINNQAKYLNCLVQVQRHKPDLMRLEITMRSYLTRAVRPRI